MIPKIIHYCWFGGAPKTDLVIKCIESWKKYCPDYEIKEWNEKNYDVSASAIEKAAYKYKQWAFVSDVARLRILYNEGGIYLDTDVELFAPLDHLLTVGSFFVFESDIYINTGMGFGCQKRHKSVGAMLHYYDDFPFIKNGVFNMKPCPAPNTEALKIVYSEFVKNGKDQRFEDVLVLSRREYEVFAKHHQAASWSGLVKRNGPYKDTWLKRFLRKPSRVEKIEKCFGRRVGRFYIWCAYDLLENGAVYFIKRFFSK